MQCCKALLLSVTRSSRCLIVLATITVLVFMNFIYTKFTYRASNTHDFSLQPKSKYVLYHSENDNAWEENCHWYFLNYTPSSWENIWYSNIEQFQQNVCETLSNADNVNKTVSAMGRLIELQKLGRKKTKSGQDTNDELLSRMFYRQQCLDSRTNVFFDVAEALQLIEPLIGLLRDSLTICARLDASLVPPSLYNGAIMSSKRFLLLSISAPFYISSFIHEPQSVPSMNPIVNHFHSTLPSWMYKRSKLNQSDRILKRDDGRIILFDLGSGYFGDQNVDVRETSTRWFYEYYKRRGLQFDRIIAFEALWLDPKIAWEQLPDDVFPIYTLINSGCTDNGAFNPWVTLQRLVKPHDHVVVKIDIDSFNIENSLIYQVLNDSSIYSLIDELFFEDHVSVKEMLRYWRPHPGTLRNLRDSYILFTKLRQLGIRMHSWP